jgi:hypothetical protein
LKAYLRSEPEPEPAPALGSSSGGGASSSAGSNAGGVRVTDEGIIPVPKMVGSTFHRDVIDNDADVLLLLYSFQDSIQVV